ncbi:uncharacterized protein MONOS_14701 [Monocercomonoides exilis]|uniref:uncharacterized protein n=1 Tax=Monocercomonoides exilis TaxID=2049356 RepID=UPI0035599D2E|nr:hypothetical protein MONOS_14701 [Monocercomonoides exilis]|eukprot:MONOS_14701.1-p1 / transcript=MONOS_14701.1 / gene=MONOS_14701 / organism=Monocercomonoides_exilis_PA203 / gene_product=unspecified product / transcript_product=unspecified product / location=Mono_scaffold01054:11438-12194(-) / protein_length=183 / sequence_SO=supercontig / SO=protein_coding / is_pseudo=false
MIAEEDGKKEGKDEKLIADLGECNLYFGCSSSLELNSILVPCLLKVALKKEENEETQKEVEMALLALSCIDTYYNVSRVLYLNEIKEIIEYHQEHHNLTQLAYQSAWAFFIRGFYRDLSLEKIFVEELHFAREARRELEELSNSIVQVFAASKDFRIEISQQCVHSLRVAMRNRVVKVDDLA